MRIEKYQYPVILLGSVVLGLCLRLAFSHNPVLVHPDEIFQVLEPAHRLAFGYGVVTWEWRDGIRSWVLPSFFAGVMKLTTSQSGDPTRYLNTIKVLLSILSLPTIVTAWKWATRTSGRTAGIVAAYSVATWHQLCVYSSHSLSEVVATDLLFPGSFLVLSSFRSFKYRVYGCLLCGCALAFRIQLAPLIVAMMGFGVHGVSKKQRWILVTCLLLPLCIFGAIDGVTLGVPFQSYWKYIWANLGQGQSLRYGIEPTYWYLERMIILYGPVLVVALVGARRCLPLAVMCSVEMVALSAIAHKEDRFIYPLVPYMLLMAAAGYSHLAASKGSQINRRSKGGIVAAIGAVLSIALSFALWPNYNFRGIPADAMIVVNELHSKSDLCGVYVDGVPWFMLGGYTYLHKDVPFLLSEGDLRQDALKGSNAMVKGEQPSGLTEPGYSPKFCRGAVCSYVRESTCEGTKESELNKILKSSGN